MAVAAAILLSLTIFGTVAYLARRNGVSWGRILLTYLLFGVFSQVFFLLCAAAFGDLGRSPLTALLIPVGVIVSTALSIKATAFLGLDARRPRERVLRGSNVGDQPLPSTYATTENIIRGSEVVSGSSPSSSNNWRRMKVLILRGALPFLMFALLFGLFASVGSTLFPRLPREDQIVVLLVSAGVALFASIVIPRVFRRSPQEPAAETRTTHLDLKQQLVLGGIPIERSIEAQHFLFAGATGAGKTQGINVILGTVRARGSRVIVADSGGASLSHFFREGDRILNPLDARTENWSPFAEIREEYDCERIATAAIPDASGDSQEWHHYARTLMAELMRSMWELKVHSTSTLLRLLMSAPVSELSMYLNGTSAQIFCQAGNEKMLANTRAILGAYLSAWRTLKDNARFSVRDWIRSEGDTSWLFVTYRDDHFALLRPMIGAWLDLAIVEGLALDEDQPHDIWFVMDEVDSLGKISHLRHALTKLRKYGCKCVLGLQTVSQLRSTYGRDEAQTLMANVGTKIVLRAGDGETAEYFSSEFGSQEIERVQHSVSKTSSVQRSKTSADTDIRETKRTVLDSEISSLSDLHGYLKSPGSLRKVRFDYRKLDRIKDAFEPRRDSPALDSQTTS